MTSSVGAAGADVWARVITPEGINHEISPWMRMTLPAAWSGSLGVGHIGRSWLLLFRVLPFEYDDLSLVVFSPGDRHFVEESTMASMRAWRHERQVSADGVLTDTISFTMRPWLFFMDRPVAWVLERFFRWRHRRLVGWFSWPSG